jgi:hypothetical protein
MQTALDGFWEKKRIVLNLLREHKKIERAANSNNRHKALWGTATKDMKSD